MQFILTLIQQLVEVLVPAPCMAAGTTAPPPQDQLRWANTGGPRSRVVSTPIVSRLLSTGDENLGLQPGGHYRLPPGPEEGGLRRLANRLLRKARFGSPDEAWQSLRGQLPDGPALVVDCPDPVATDITPEDGQKNLIAALVLGKCCGSLFSPNRPVIWSERRLSRSVRLVHCDSETFAGEDDE